MKHPAAPVALRLQSGVGLIEVLIALVILSIGLLGSSALVLNSLRANDSSTMRGQAAILGNSILDNMRANKLAAIGGSYNTSIGTAVSNPGNNCSSTCTAAQLATLDVYNWKQALNVAYTPAGGLPYGDGGISLNTANGLTTVTITVKWDDSRALNAFTPGSCASPPCYTTLTMQSIL